MFRHPRPFRFFRPIARLGHLRSGLCLYAIILTLCCQVFTGFTSVSAATNSADDLNRTPIASTAPVSAAKNTNNFYFTDFEADYYLSRAADGTSRLRVVERLTAVFPDTDQNHGITRVIPYTNQDGHNLTIADDRAFSPVVRHNGEPEAPAEIERSDDGYYVVYLGDADTYLHGTHTYELEYEFQQSSSTSSPPSTTKITPGRNSTGIPTATIGSNPSAKSPPAFILPTPTLPPLLLVKLGAMSVATAATTSNAALLRL